MQQQGVLRPGLQILAVRQYKDYPPRALHEGVGQHKVEVLIGRGGLGKVREDNYLTPQLILVFIYRVLFIFRYYRIEFVLVSQ